ncbi:uncharacterized protein LOC135490892 [Lineus longissimus]|uniref:uncharacterized protein LOC135490892 n=1 Tax=Lineus longissimus TaxID=88925 RepID=UPI002B4D2965
MAKPSREACREVGRIFARIICVIILAIQGGLIDYYLVVYVDSYVNYNWLAWIVADIANCVIFIITLIVSYKTMYTRNRRDMRSKGMILLKSLEGNNTTGELPMGYIAWGIYSVLLITRLAIFFKTGAAKLNEDDAFGPNLMKTAIGLSAFVFMFLVSSSHGANPHTERATYIEKLIGSTTLDILDSVEFLEILFIQESKIFLTFDLWNCVLAFSCINLLLPTMPLIVLSHTRFGRAPGKRVVKILHSVLFIFLINVPFLILRLYLWHVLNRDISVFIIKNGIMIMMGCKEIFELSESLTEDVDGKTAPVAADDDGENIEMDSRDASQS